MDIETVKNISTFVEITMQVSDRLNARHEMEVEAYQEELGALQKRVEELTSQKDRQAGTIEALRAKVDGMVLDSVDGSLKSKLDKAMDHIRRQGEEIDKLRSDAADPRWIPLKQRKPDADTAVLVCTKRGAIDVAQETIDGWKRSTGKMAEPVAWMPLPAKYEEKKR